MKQFKALCEEILGEARKSGEVLFPLLQFVNNSKSGKKWGEIKDFMVEKGFAGPKGEITMLMRPTHLAGDSEYSFFGGYTTKDGDKWKINASGKKRLKEYEEKNKK